MKLLNINGQKAEIKFSLDELLLLNSMFAEVCYALSIPKFEIKIGTSREKILKIFDVVHNYLIKLKDPPKHDINSWIFFNPDTVAKKVAISIPLNQLIFLEPVFNEVFRQIDDWEFQTRTGFTREEAMIVLNEIKGIVAKF